MQSRPEFLTPSRPEPTGAEVALALGTVDVDGKAAPLTRHRRPLLALTGLRFFAAAYVVTFHTRVAALLLAAGYLHGSRFFSNGYLAVALFFLLSGFILAYTYRDQISGKGSATRFWEARFARLWPAYALSLLCSSLPGMAVPSWPLALATLTMVQAWNPWRPDCAGAWNFVCWTLSVEAFFYLAFPFFQRRFDRLKAPLLAAIGVVLLLSGMLANVSARTLSDLQYPAPWNRIPLPVIHLPEFLVGVVLGNLFVLSNAEKVSANRHPEARHAGRSAPCWVCCRAWLR